MNIFFTSDTHFGHTNICKFTKSDGSKLRPWDNVDEMDEALIKNWNEVVKKGDRIYHLGDVAMPRKSLELLYRLNGDKILIKGNHDVHKLKDYLPHFREIHGAFPIKKFILTHIPVHSDSKNRYTANIHGHLHSQRVKMNVKGSEKIDPFYICVSVENTDYKPISYEEILKQVGGD